MLTKAKIRIIAAFAGAVLSLALVGIVYWLDTQKEDEIDFSMGVSKDKVFSRAELDRFVQSCNMEQFLEVCGDNIATIEQQDNGALAMVYTYHYPREKLSDEFCRQYGYGFSVKFLDDQPIDWDVTDLPGTIAAMSQEQLDATLKVGMTAAEIKAILGEPNKVSRANGQMHYTYHYQTSHQKKPDTPLSLSITLEQEKAVSRENVSESAQPETTPRAAEQPQ